MATNAFRTKVACVESMMPSLVIGKRRPLSVRHAAGHGPAMSDTPSETDRIARLEVRFTEQEAVIEDLNATITAQWRVIDRLTRQLARLQEQMEEAAFRGAGSAAEPPPPHY